MSFHRPHALENGQLLCLVRIVDLQLQHEAIELRFRQRIGAFLLDGVLRRDHQERRFEQVGVVANGDLLFLHGFEESALHLGGSAVDLVGQHQIGEDGALLDGELAGPRIVDLRADDVGGQKIRRELNAVKVQPQTLRDRSHGEGLGQAGHALDKDMPAGEQAEQQAIDHGALADDHLLDLAIKGIEAGTNLDGAAIDVFVAHTGIPKRQPSHGRTRMKHG